MLWTDALGDNWPKLSIKLFEVIMAKFYPLTESTEEVGESDGTN